MLKFNILDEPSPPNKVKAEKVVTLVSHISFIQSLFLTIIVELNFISNLTFVVKITTQSKVL